MTPRAVSSRVAPHSHIRYSEDGESDGGEDAVQDDRLTVAEAAQRLGISKEAVRKRIMRGTLRSDKDRDGTVRVYMPPSSTESGTPSDAPSELVVELRDRINSLERRLDEERDANKEMRRLLAGLIERVPQLEAPKEQQEAPTEPQNQAQEPEQGEAGVEDREPEKRPWWRRVFGE